MKVFDLGLYTLRGHTPVKVRPGFANVLSWARWLETANRHVADTTFGDGTRVSTVFLGIDYNLHGGGRPVLFETMIFGNKLDQLQRRYGTWDEAAAGHKRVVKQVEALRAQNRNRAAHRSRVQKGARTQ